MTSASFLHPPQPSSTSSATGGVVFTSSGSASDLNGAIGKILSSASSSPASSSSLSTSSTSSVNTAISVVKRRRSSKKRLSRTSETLIATATAILKMLGVSSSSTTASNGSGKMCKQKAASQPKISSNSNKNPEKVMPTMPKAKTSSLSETDCDEENLFRGKPMVNSVRSSTQQNKESPTSTATTTTASSAPAHSESNNGVTTTTAAPTKRSVNDFRFGKTIGEGSFSTVYLAKDIHTGKEYAIKVCDKHHIIREKKQEYIKREREVMNIMGGCPGFVNLYCTFQDARSLYFVMTFAKNGDLLPYIYKVGSFNMSCTRFYAAELVLALENMHRRGVIHRDLKPENILLDDNMHTLIADFGSAKIVPKVGDSVENGNATSVPDEPAAPNNPWTRARKNSFVGTAQYVSPEILKGNPSTNSADLWALGCIIYQMISGLPPFRAGSEYLIFEKILKQDISFPDGFDKEAKDLVEKLLVLDPRERIGAKDSQERYDSIRSHPFFDEINWDNLHGQTSPQINPYLPGLTQEEGELWSNYRVPDHLEPGLDEKQLTRLLGLDLGPSTATHKTQRNLIGLKSIANVPEREKEARLELQKTDKWHQFAEGELILKQGFVNKRKGLFARKRMLLLTTGPRLIYIDPAQMVKKGEIPWSPELRVEMKNFKIFFVHTPNRTYYLDDPEGFARNWCEALDDVRKFTYGDDEDLS